MPARDDCDASPELIIKLFQSIDPFQQGVIDARVLLVLTKKLEPLFGDAGLDALLQQSGALHGQHLDYTAFVNYVYAPSAASPAKKRLGASISLDEVEDIAYTVLDSPGITEDFFPEDVFRPASPSSPSARSISSRRSCRATTIGSSFTSVEYCCSDDEAEDVVVASTSMPVKRSQTLTRDELRDGLAHFHDSILTDMCVVRFLEFSELSCIPRSDQVNTVGRTYGNSKVVRRQRTLTRWSRRCVFVSHRWTAPSEVPPLPDDKENTKHRLIVAGVTAIADRHGWSLDNVDVLIMHVWTN